MSLPPSARMRSAYLVPMRVSSLSVPVITAASATPQPPTPPPPPPPSSWPTQASFVSWRCPPSLITAVRSTTADRPAFPRRKRNNLLVWVVRYSRLHHWLPTSFLSRCPPSSTGRGSQDASARLYKQTPYHDCVFSRIPGPIGPGAA